MSLEINRRTFLEGAGLLTLSLLRLQVGPSSALAMEGKSLGAATGAKYRSFEDVYREQWKWDRVVRAAHHVVNCASSCPFNLFVKDGIVLREEQNPVMEANNSSLPDFNPRGCQKGVCFSQLMYSPARLFHPLKRVGERGEGRWKRITWDEALDEITEKILEVSVEHGPECVVYDSGTANAGYGAATSGELAFFDHQGATMLDGWAAVGDMPLGAILTWGLFNMDSSSDDYFNSDLVLLWLGNPSYTRIPDAHFLWEARYNGTKIVSIAPDYNASTMHCDQWVNVRMGTDSALGLAMANVLVSEKLYKESFVKEQTDLVLLVREDDGHFLRQADVNPGGADNVFYLWDRNTNRAVEAPGSEGLGRTTTLQLGELDPALEGRFSVPLTNGQKVSVRPVFESLKERLAKYTPEAASGITGIAADEIRELARQVGRAKAMSVFGSWGMMKHHHSDLFQRAIILLLALTGNVGRRGTGIRIGAWYMLSGIESIMRDTEPTWFQKALMYLFQPTVREMIGFFRKFEDESMYMNVPALMFLYEHGGLKDVVTDPKYHGPNPGKPHDEAMRECIENRWVPLYPRPGKTPKLYIHTRVNPLRRWPAPHVVERELWPKLDLIVGVNIKMSTTASKSDIVLPAAGYYERRGIKYAQSYVPYYAVGEKAVEPLGESKTEYEIFGLLARRVQARARAREVQPVLDAKDNPRDLAQIYDNWSRQGLLTPEDDLPYYDLATSKSSSMGYIPWKEAAERGAIRIQDLGPFRSHTNICSDYEPGDTVYSSQWFVQYKQPWPTLTGRMQFYIDHDWYLAAGEELPTHKDPPKAGGDYPLRITGGHTRWSIHSTWVDEPHMLQLQRGEPAAFLSPTDAAARGIVDNDRIRMSNDIGGCELLAKISSSVQPGTVIVYHAWEPHQFKDWRGSQEPIPSPWKAVHMTEYGQLHYRFLWGGPHHTPRGTTIEIQKA
jgi:DMSO reductase family type II enzyme molybdopterin subunit